MIGSTVDVGTTIYTVILMVITANVLFVFFPSFIINEFKKISEHMKSN